MFGKKVLSNVYWHGSLTDDQDNKTQQTVTATGVLAQLKPGLDYNVIKYDGTSSILSLLWYPNFFEEPFLALETSFRIDLTTQRVEKRRYQTSLNPPILHRKELLPGHDHPDIEQFKQLTETAEQLGLFDDTIKIGFKQAWDALIREKGFQIIDNQFI
ncbi:MAG: hypothetical protein RQ715_10640 [Methylococcales bacterium]|nr:hypothetical protein [Methylococcales bacterium]